MSPERTEHCKKDGKFGGPERAILQEGSNGRCMNVSSQRVVQRGQEVRKQQGKRPNPLLGFMGREWRKKKMEALKCFEGKIRILTGAEGREERKRE
jgi:hypothetical protein